MRIESFIQNAFKASLFSLCLVLSSASLSQLEAKSPRASKETTPDKDVFAQLSSFNSQLPGSQGTEVVFENTDGISGLTLQNQKKIVVQKDGLYLITATGQAGSSGIGFRGDVKLWINKNGNAINYSNKVQTVTNVNSIYVVTSHVAIKLEAGDKISIGISAKSVNLGLIALPSAAPSIILSMVKIGEK